EHSDLDWTYGPLGKLIVSPHYHRIHHSIAESDFNKNFGSFLSFWDPLFGTASSRATRPEAYGAPQMNVPESFVRQFFYPFFWLSARLKRASVPGTEPVVITPAPTSE